MATPASRAPLRAAARPAPVRPVVRAAGAATSRNDVVRSRTPSSNAPTGASSRELQELRAQVAQSDETIRGLEKERDFYFNKLRDIEILVQQFAAEIEEKAQNTGEPVAEESELLVKDIQTILYSTEVFPWLSTLTDRRDLRCPLRMVKKSWMIMRPFNMITGVDGVHSL